MYKVYSGNILPTTEQMRELFVKSARQHEELARITGVSDFFAPISVQDVARTIGGPIGDSIMRLSENRK